MLHDGLQKEVEMTYQERWAEGPPVGEPSRVADLLQPKGIRVLLSRIESSPEDVDLSEENIPQLCRDYLTLWEQVRDLESLLDAEGIYRGEPID